MMLRRLKIEHFRGIERAEWVINQRLVGLIGAGDSTKTTILNAIGLVLSPTYNPQFTDADFHNFDLSKNIVIQAVITDLPDNLVKENQLGKNRSGLTSDGVLMHDPVDEAEECLIIRLTVTPELDPTWEIIRPGSDEIRPITASQRRQLGFFWLGDRPDFHLRWSRGSALSGLTDDRDGASSVILDAYREARAAVFNADPNALHVAAEEVQRSAAEFGAAAFNGLRPGLEPSSTTSSHALLLHDQEVPLSNFGLGTRRLTSLSIQEQAMNGGSIIVIDEIEHGLEPHRLTQVLYQLKKRAQAGELQVIMTTHSPITVKTLSATDLVVVHAAGSGITTCLPVPEELDNVQGTVRTASEALLGRRVLVGEGATEVGFLRGLLRYWDVERSCTGKAPAAAIGTVMMNGGGGASALQRAQTFQKLGYSTGILIDNDDRDIDKLMMEVEASGVFVCRWSDGNALEDEVIQTLSDEGLQAVVTLAVSLRGEQSIQATVGARLGMGQLTGTNISGWMTQADCDNSAMRNAIAQAAAFKKKEWFKREDRGEDLAEVVMNHREGLESTHLMRILSDLQNFAYPDDPAFAASRAREVNVNE